MPKKAKRTWRSREVWRPVLIIVAIAFNLSSAVINLLQHDWMTATYAVAVSMLLYLTLKQDQIIEQIMEYLKTADDLIDGLEKLIEGITGKKLEVILNESDAAREAERKKQKKAKTAKPKKK